MEADEVTIVVHGARNLQGKKPGRCKFSVIFGLGSKKYRTSIVKEPTGNPDWNEESIVSVQNTSDHVFFTVTEKDDVLGQVQLPITSLQMVKGQVRRTTLKAHKKCPVPQGDLIFQAYVSKQRPLTGPTNPQIKSSSPATTGGPQQLTGFARLRHSLAVSPILPHRTMKRESKDSTGEKEEKRKSSTLANFNKKLSKSIHDIFHLGRLGGNDDDDQKTSNRKMSKFGSMNSGLDHAGDVPIVSNIIPNMATVHGGTRLCVEGRNLGLGKSDIMEFLLCGSDLLDTIEFESEHRIYVTTKENTPGKGDLWIETVSGGQNVIKNLFTFVDRSAEKTGSLERQAPPSPVIIPPSPDRDPPPQPSPMATTRAKSVLLDDSDLTAEEINRSANHHNTSLHRSSSQQDKSTLSSGNGASTLPRVKSTTDLDPDAALQPEAPGRFRKNYQKHARRASESVVAMQRDAEGRSSASEKADLQKEIVRLMKENESLRQDNADLHTYIEKLVARVLISCPEVLAAGEDLKLPAKKT